MHASYNGTKLKYKIRKETYMKIVVIRSPRAVRYILSKIFNVEIKKEHK